MKKTALYVYGAIIISLLLLFAFIRISSFHKIAFTISQPNLKVEVFRQFEGTKTEKVGEFTQATDLTLENGSYYYIASGENAAVKVTKFEVDRAQKIDVQPGFDQEYLASLLKSEQEALTAMIAKSNPRIDVYFNINNGKLFGIGDWYGTTLTSKQAEPNQPSDFYRVLMKKEGGQWKLLGKPKLIWSVPDHPEIPRDILSQLNKLDPTFVTTPASAGSPD